MHAASASAMSRRPEQHVAACRDQTRHRLPVFSILGQANRAVSVLLYVADDGVGNLHLLVKTKREPPEEMAAGQREHRHAKRKRFA